MKTGLVMAVALAVSLGVSAPSLTAQQQQGTFAAEGIPAVPLPDVPIVFDTAEGQRIRVTVVTTGLSNPWGFAFLPDGDLLITERGGRLRRLRDGVLDPTPVPGLPEIFTGVSLAGLMDIALHRQFTEL